MKKHEFQPKEWVLVRDDEKEKWKLDIFSHFEDGFSFPYRCVGSYYDECLPYAGNEALLGTTDTPEEKHVWHAGDRVDVLSDFDDMWHPGFIVEIDYTRSNAGFSYRVESECFKSITGKAWCKADQLRKPEEKPEEEFKVGDKVEVQYCWDDKWYAGTIVEIDPDHTNFDGKEFPYKVAADCFKGSRWCSKGQLREPVDKPEEKEFKFGDRVEANIDGEWCEAVVIEIDHSDIPYKVATADGDVRWCAKSRVRRA